MPYDGIATIHYSVAGVPCGTQRVYCCSVVDCGIPHSAYWPHYAYFCPECGEIWGRARYDYKFNYSPRVQAPWMVVIRRCAQHGDGCFLDGLVIEGCDSDLMRRELSAWMDAATGGDAPPMPLTPAPSHAEGVGGTNTSPALF